MNWWGGGGGGGGPAPVSPTFIGFSSATLNGTITLSNTLSAGALQVGDLMLVCVSNSPNPPTFPVGFNPLAPQQVVQFNGTAAKSTWYWRIADGFEPANYAGWGGGLCSGALAVFRGAGQFSSLPVISDHATSSIAPTVPQITTRVANQLVIASLPTSGGPLTPPGAYTTIVNIAGVGGTNFALWLGYLSQAPAGVVAAAAGAMTIGNWGAEVFAIGQ